MTIINKNQGQPGFKGRLQITNAQKALRGQKKLLDRFEGFAKSLLDEDVVTLSREDDKFLVRHESDTDKYLHQETTKKGVNGLNDILTTLKGLSKKRLKPEEDWELISPEEQQAAQKELEIERRAMGKRDAFNFGQILYSIFS